MVDVYNQTTEGIRRNKRQNKAIIYLFAFCFIAMLVFTGTLYFRTLELVQVVEPNGRYLPTRLERKEKLLVSTIKDFSVTVNSLINTIDRMTLKENIARARFIVSNSDLAFIFNTYKKNKYYSRAKEQGYYYKSKVLGYSDINPNDRPYFVEFISKTSVMDGTRLVEEFYVRASGYITEQTPQFEETTHGFYFSEYKQQYSKLPFE